MIKIDTVSKAFGDIRAVDNITLDIKNDQLFGLVGTNGAGKSTLMRMLSGVLRADEGSIQIDDLPVWDNPEAKEKLIFIPDEPFFFANATAEEMGNYYKTIYRRFDSLRFKELLGNFSLEGKRKIRTYSKGMKRQLALILGICAGTEYLICDEVFDGLDPVARQAFKSILAGEMDARGLTPVIASHNLRELEDICDHVGLLHKGGLILSENLEEMKLGILKVQCVFENEAQEKEILSDLDVISLHRSGRLATLVIRGEEDRVMRVLGGASMVFYEVLPLTLEEIFISETEAVGYDVRKYILS